MHLKAGAAYAKTEDWKVCGRQSMYDKHKFFPFYTSIGDQVLLSGENMQEREFALMKSYFPETARKIQEKVEEECELLDYEGSRIYDEYPDRLMMRGLGDGIFRRMQKETAAQELPSGFLEDLVQVLLYQEISRRRCRRKRCRGY